MKRIFNVTHLVFLVFGVMIGYWAIQISKLENSNDNSLVVKSDVLAEKSEKTCHTNGALHNLECKIGTETLCTHYRKIKLKVDECGAYNVDICVLLVKRLGTAIEQLSKGYNDVINNVKDEKKNKMLREEKERRKMVSLIDCPLRNDVDLELSVFQC